MFEGTQETIKLAMAFDCAIVLLKQLCKTVLAVLQILDLYFFSEW